MLYKKEIRNRNWIYFWAKII